MAISSNLNGYWDEFIDTFARALLEDGYDEFEILDKMMTSFKAVRESKRPVVIPETTNNSIKKEFDTEEALVLASNHNKPKTYSEHRKPISRENNPHNYDKTLSNKFLHAEVFIPGVKESLATIEYGPNQRQKDAYKLVSTNEKLSEIEYLRRFYSGYSTPKGMSFLNRHKILFRINPEISVGYVKNNAHYYQFKTIDDIKAHKKIYRQPKGE